MNKMIRRLCIPFFFLLTGCSGTAGGFFDDYGKMKELYNGGLQGTLGNRTNQDALTDKLEEVFGQALGLIQFLWGGLLAVCIVAMIVTFVRYGMSGGDSRKREEAKHNILVVLILTACVGAFPLILRLISAIYGALQNIF